MWLSLLLACSPDGGADPVPNAASFALLELFTSQSCSSCPGADQQLSVERAMAAMEGRRVFTAAWHVDTWDGLGWVDPYSSPQATERQRRYADVHASRTYTPQLLVNGQDEMVGKNASEVGASIDRWLMEPASAALAVSAEVVGDEVAVDVVVEGASASEDLVVLLLQHGIVDDIPSGENGGRTLEEDSAVRAFRTVAPGTADVRLPLPAAVAVADLEVLAIVQDPGTMVVAGAESVALAP
ncbi:MAG: DUF1223 domain-containing protein [Alphaproteobacteria bacterium]|nr:DUF1223 domain-containing protein [Alphaproteobacteria bacterium]